MCGRARSSRAGACCVQSRTFGAQTRVFGTMTSICFVGGYGMFVLTSGRAQESSKSKGKGKSKPEYQDAGDKMRETPWHLFLFRICFTIIALMMSFCDNVRDTCHQTMARAWSRKHACARFRLTQILASCRLYFATA